MTSINYNASAITALRTLQQTNSALETTQNRVSTGLKIGEAKDNAAYWSISTTLKSDNKALSTVKDALGLGAATVDTAYQGLNKALEVLDEIKSKVTAATQDGVDKTAIQAEITELQKQLVSIATASSFSKENWLSVDSSSVGYTSERSVVSSFNRDASNGVSIGTIGIDISAIALFDTSATGEGILNGGKSGNATATGKLVSGVDTSTLTGGTNTKGQISIAAFTTPQAGDSFSIDLTIDNGQTKTVTFTATASATTTGDAFKAAIEAAFGTTAVTVTNTAGAIVIQSNLSGAGSRVVNTAFVKTGAGSTAAGAITNTAANGIPAAYDKAAVTNAAFAAGDAFTLDSDDSISFKLAVDGGDTKVVTIRKATVDAALGTTDGKVGDAVAMKNVLARALSDAKIEGVTVSQTAGAITFQSNAATATSKIEIYDVAASKGTAITDVNVVGASKTQLADYISSINTAIDKVTTAASNLGAVAARIDLQDTFVDTLIDTIDKGVSGLIDADLSEESTRLQALQTKQQLGIQALSIANTSTQNVLSLFRS